MQEYVCYFITFLELDSFDSSSGLSHRSEVTTLKEQHPSMFSQNTDMISFIYCFNTQYFFFVSKLHNHGRKLFERKYQFFFDFFAAILIGKEDKMLIVKMERFGKYDLAFESEVFVEIQRILFHHKASEIFESLNYQFSYIGDNDQFVLIVCIDEIHSFIRYSLYSRLI